VKILVAGSSDVEERTEAKRVMEKIIEENKEVYSEVAEFMALLRELGLTSYKLTGSLQEPIITRYSIS
jgi:hypothetical protein